MHERQKRASMLQKQNCCYRIVKYFLSHMSKMSKGESKDIKLNFRHFLDFGERDTASLRKVKVLYREARTVQLNMVLFRESKILRVP